MEFIMMTRHESTFLTLESMVQVKSISTYALRRQNVPRTNYNESLLRIELLFIKIVSPFLGRMANQFETPVLVLGSLILFFFLTNSQQIECILLSEW